MGKAFGASNSRRTERRITNEAERRLTFGGLLVIDLQIVSPKEWCRMESHLGMDTKAHVDVRRRSVDLSNLAKLDQCDALKAVTLSELNLHLEQTPDSPIFVTPGITVTGTAPDRAFFSEVQKRSGEWHRRLYRQLGKCQRRRLASIADLSTRMLVYHGTLMVDGLIYKPGCWPNRSNVNHQAPTSSRRILTVDPGVLGLESSEPAATYPPVPPKDHRIGLDSLLHRLPMIGEAG